MSGRAAAAAFYPLRLLKAILRGMGRASDSIQQVQAIAEEEYDTHLLMSMTPPEPLPDHSQAVPESSLPKQGGGTVRIRYEACNFKQSYVDEYTREQLPQDLVKAATIEELKYFNDKVWELADAKAVLGEAGRR